MLISKQSWHYKVAKFWFRWDDEAPKSLCPYFWNVIFGAAKGVVAGLGFAVLFSLFCAGAVFLLAPFIIGDNQSRVVGFVSWCAFGAVCITIVRDLRRDYKKSPLFKEIKLPGAKLPQIELPGTPSFIKVLTEYAKAAHNKVCPTVKFQ